MTTIIKDKFSTGAYVSMDMDPSEKELYVFYHPVGQGYIVKKYPLDSYHMQVALDYYNECCEQEAAMVSALEEAP